MVSIVAGTYNEQKYLDKFFASLYNQTYEDILEIILVDNGSRDGSVEHMRENYPKVKLIQMGGNVGFCRQYNTGIKESKGEYVLILNVDMVLTEKYVEEVLRAAKRDECIGRVAGKLYFMREDGTFTNIIDSAGHSIDKGRWHKNIGDFLEDDGSYDEEKYVFGVCGAAGFYKREMLEDIAIEGQYFDESFFQTIEDVDLDWRGQLRGWKCYYTPKAVAYHVRKGSRWDKDRFIMYHHYKNRYLLIVKNDLVRSVLLCLPHIIWHEMRLFYVLWKYPSHRFDRVSLIKGIFGFFLYLGVALKKRRMVQARRGMSYKYISSLFEKPRG